MVEAQALSQFDLFGEAGLPGDADEVGALEDGDEVEIEGLQDVFVVVEEQAAGDVALEDAQGVVGALGVGLQGVQAFLGALVEGLLAC